MTALRMLQNKFKEYNTMMRPEISVIVPVYNTGIYLAPCIESILNQTFSNLELILVNDGSTDGSAVICEQYAKQDKRVRVLHKENGGVIRALEKGVEAALGCWIAFVDHDDTLPPDALSLLYKLTGETSDIIVGFSWDGDHLVREIPIDDWRRMMVESDAILCTRWAKLYRKEVLGGGAMYASDAIKMGEDMIMNIKASLRTEKPVVVIQSKVYEYNRNQGSFSVKFKRNADWCGAVYDEVRRCIPETPVLKKACVLNGLKMVKNLLLHGDADTCRTLGDSTFLGELREDISSTVYPLSKFDTLVLARPASFVTRMLIRVDRLWKMVLKKLR